MLFLKNCKTNIKILFEIDYSPRKVLNFINRFNNNFGINYDTGNSASLGFKLNEEKTGWAAPGPHPCFKIEKENIGWRRSCKKQFSN